MVMFKNLPYDLNLKNFIPEDNINKDEFLKYFRCTLELKMKVLIEEMKFLSELKDCILDKNRVINTTYDIKILQNSEIYNLKENISIYNI